jgi:hypothetical protein
VALKVAILVPRRSDGGRRDEIWVWVKNWLETHHPEWPIFEGVDDVNETFSMGLARNDAARKAGDWDVGVLVDSDTIAHPDAVKAAVKNASNTRILWVAGDVRMRMDKTSSDRILNGGLWFPRPEGERHPKGNVINEMCYGEPSSGVIAVNRTLWNATGGYIESLQGWGWEDLAFITQCYIAGKGMAWVKNSPILHFWHERTPLTEDTDFNKQIWLKLHNFSTRRDIAGARAFLHDLGHTLP